MHLELERTHMIVTNFILLTFLRHILSHSQIAKHIRLHVYICPFGEGLGPVVYPYD